MISSAHNYFENHKVGIYPPKIGVITKLLCCCCCWCAINLAGTVDEAFSEIWPAQVIYFTAEFPSWELVPIFITRGSRYMAYFRHHVAPLVIYDFA